jgi:hypothetical protein
MPMSISSGSSGVRSRYADSGSAAPSEEEATFPFQQEQPKIIRTVTAAILLFLTGSVSFLLGHCPSPLLPPTLDLPCFLRSITVSLTLLANYCGHTLFPLHYKPLARQ